MRTGRRPTAALLLPLVCSAAAAAGAAGGCRPRAREGASATQTPGAPPTDTVPSATALHNLNASVDLLETQLRAAPADTREAQGRRDQLTGLLMMRAQVLGHLTDYDRALALAEDGVRARPQDPAALETRARVRERLHLFAGALADLDAAVAHGASESGLQGVRAAILGATGHDAEAQRLIARHNAAYPDLYTLGAEALAVARAGDLARAEALFARARAVYRDVSPFPPAWLDLQHGRVMDELGDRARARTFFEAAHVRVPEYAEAVARLAELAATDGGPEGRARAVALLRPLVASSDDPQYTADLSELLATDAHDADEAARLRAQAARGYELLLARQHAAFLDQAARFWLGTGADPARAAALAEENATLRPTKEARALLAAARAASTTAGHAAR